MGLIKRALVLVLAILTLNLCLVLNVKNLYAKEE